MHNALVVVGQVKEVTIVVNFKVALLSPEQRVKIRVNVIGFKHGSIFYRALYGFEFE